MVPWRRFRRCRAARACSARLVPLRAVRRGIARRVASWGLGLSVMARIQGSARVSPGRGGAAFRCGRGAARTGLALLQIQARASDPALQPGWVYRRVQQLEFLDTRAVRWRVSVDFEVPQDAPIEHLGGHNFYLVPITSMAKTDLVAFDLRDEMGAAVWMPTSGQTTGYLASALVYWASADLGRPAEDLPDALVRDIWRVVSDRPAQIAAEPPALLAAAALRDARRRHVLAARRLADSRAALERACRAGRFSAVLAQCAGAGGPGAS
jgi:hypothetical protein